MQEPKLDNYMEAFYDQCNLKVRLQMKSIGKQDPALYFEDEAKKCTGFLLGQQIISDQKASTFLAGSINYVYVAAKESATVSDACGNVIKALNLFSDPDYIQAVWDQAEYALDMCDVVHLIVDPNTCRLIRKQPLPYNKMPVPIMFWLSTNDENLVKHIATFEPDPEYASTWAAWVKSNTH